MAALLTTLFFIALVDSTSMIPIAAIPLAAILGAKRPYPSACGFLAGIFVIYVLAGVLIYFGLDALFSAIMPFALRVWTQPSTPELGLQMALGAIMLCAAWRKYRYPVTVTEHSNSTAFRPWGAFVTGFSLTVIGMPGAIPYFGAIDQILRADISLLTSLGAIMFYSLAFLTPFLALLLVRMLLPAQSERVFRTSVGLIKRWGNYVLVVALVLLGITFIADGVGWFMGMPLLPVDTAETTTHVNSVSA